jgi:hypothetical protein
MPIPVPTTYSSDVNVTEKISHVSLPEKLVVANFRDEAFTYMNMRLRSLYLTPVSGSLTTMSYLKHLESNLAAGKILMAVGTVNASSELSEYGKMLMGLGEKALALVLGSDTKEPGVVLEGAPLDPDKSDNLADFPHVVLDSPDDFATFNRPISGIESDAIRAVTDAKEYSEENDILTQ